MSLIQQLPEGPLDIIGDIHGEYDALVKLLHHLGYDDSGIHPNGRTVVFVGDFVDRGHNSTAVLALAQRWVEAGRAVAILGNHEINLLRSDVKEGSGWFFDAQHVTDSAKFGDYHRPDSVERNQIVEFLSSLPIGLERKDLRVIHAVWNKVLIDQLGHLNAGCVADEFDELEVLTENQAKETGLFQRMVTEKTTLLHGLKDAAHRPKFLPAHAEYEQRRQMDNPLKVLTSGVERIINYPTTKPFLAGGKWRFVERVAWWDDYNDDIPVVVGHYWRRENEDFDPGSIGKNNADLFDAIHPYSWHGKRGNVFCVDFSVGARWKERTTGSTANHRTRLAALRWPERSLMFDDGRAIQTDCYLKNIVG